MINKATAVALKFFALYMIFSVLVTVPSVLSIAWVSLPMEKTEAMPWLIPLLLLGASVILAAIGIGLLWKTANSLLSKDGPTSTESTPVDLDKLFQLAISVMGLYFVLNALIALPYQWHTFQIVRSQGMPLSLSKFPHLISTGLRLLFGGLLIAKPKQWVRWLSRIRGM